ncbi:hypothetical protein KIPB_013237, partial [Kipferlia bialata]
TTPAQSTEDDEPDTFNATPMPSPTSIPPSGTASPSLSTPGQDTHESSQSDTERERCDSEVSESSRVKRRARRQAKLQQRHSEEAIIDTIQANYLAEVTRMYAKYHERAGYGDRKLIIK